MLMQRSLATAVLLSVLLALPACAFGHPGGGASGSRSTASSASASPDPTTNGLTSTTFTVPKGDGTDKQVFRFTVTALYRSGPFTRIGFTVACDESSTQQCQPNYDWGSKWDDYGQLGLVDSVEHKTYDPVLDKDDHPFTSAAHGLDPGKAEDGWAVFPPVPGGTTVLDVTLPDGGPTLLDVPLGQPSPETQRAEPADFDKPADTIDASGLQLPVVPLQLRTASEGEETRESKDRVDVTLSADVLFAFGKADLASKAHSMLQRVARGIDQSATGIVGITGYTDSKGTPKVNGPLSGNRARAVADYVRPLVHRSLRYSVKGRGDADPVAPNTKPDGSDNPKGRVKNRRVTITYTKEKPKRVSPTPTRPGQTPAAPGPTTWVHRTSNATDTYRFSANGITRHGDLAVLKFSLTCVKATGSGSASGCWTMYDLSGAEANNTVGALTLYQVPDKTRYFPVADLEKHTLSTDVPDNIKVGVQHDFWVYFPAPPQDVTAIDVSLPDATTVHDVSIA